MFDVKKFEETLTQLVKEKKLTSKTKRYYLANIAALEDALPENAKTAGELEQCMLLLTEDTHQIAKYIAAVKKYEVEILGESKKLLYGETLQRMYRLCNLSEGLEPRYSEDTYFRKINGLRNERLKLAFRLQYQSGLRLFEVAKLKKGDLQFEEDTGEIAVFVRVGKRRKTRMVTVKDAYLYERLQAYLESIEDDENVFYSESYLAKKANEHGIATHDLRRINARKEYRNHRSSGLGKRAARRMVSKRLDHEKPSTTNIYLGKEWYREGGENDFEETE